MSKKLPAGPNPREYQIGITDRILKHEQGILNLGTGYGKTFVAAKLAEETNLKTLIIVHRGDILQQFKDFIKNGYGYDVGIISGNTFEIRDITIAMIQTLKLRDLSKIRSEFGMIICDECHTMVGEKSYKVISSFNPFRLYGMTGTADRSDGQGEAIKFYFGDIIVKEDLPQKKPVVEVIKFKEEFWGSDYHEIIESQCENLNRNKLIADIIKKEKGRKILVLTKRVKHYELIYDLLPSDLKSYKIYSKTKASEKEIRSKLLEKLRDGSSDFDVIMGTFSLLSTGVNIPALDTLIIAGDLKSEVLSRQSVGRILRLFADKKQPKIIDIDDAASGILHNQALARRRMYKQNNWEII